MFKPITGSILVKEETMTKEVKFFCGCKKVIMLNTPEPEMCLIHHEPKIQPLNPENTNRKQRRRLNKMTKKQQ